MIPSKNDKCYKENRWNDMIQDDRCVSANQMADQRTDPTPELSPE